MAKQPNNPAGRLLAIIRKLQSIRKKNNVRTEQAWAELFDINPNDSGLLLSRIGGCLQLNNEILEKIKTLDVSFELYAKDINQIASAFQEMNQKDPVQNTLSRIKVESIRGLEYCDHELSKSFPEKVLPEDKLKEIHERICLLYEEVAQADIDGYLRDFILDKLDLLRQAIELYEVNGSKPIEKGLYEITGQATFFQDKLKGQDAKKIRKKFGSILASLFLITQIVNNTAQLPESVSKILPGTVISTQEINESEATAIETEDK